MQSINNKIFSTWTNLFLLIPASAALIKGEKTFLFLISFLFIFSTLYHLKKPSGVDWWWHKKKPSQHLFQILDTSFGIAIGVIMFQKVLHSEVSIFLILFLFLVLVDFIFLFLSNKYYEKYHSIWHILSSIIILFSLFL